MTVAVIHTPGRRHDLICSAMLEGIAACGDRVVEIRDEFYQGPNHPVAVFYGLKGRCAQAFSDYRHHNKPVVYIDLGYWGRVEGGKLYGFHKLAVGARHPTDYFQRVKHTPNRFHHHGLRIKPWQREGRHILVAGMGAKAAAFEGFRPTEWEQKAVDELRKHTDRPIIYRPKPSWHYPEGIEGTLLSTKEQPLADVLQNCHAVVSHHSNVCVDALVEGVPVFCWEGVASVMGLKDLSLIETPVYPDGREQWCADVAWTQWSVAEMRSGAAWRYLKSEGLVPHETS